MLPERLTKKITKLEKEMRWVRRKVKLLVEFLEFADNINPLSFKELLNRDKEIIKALLAKGREGASTTELAVELNYLSPKTSGRTIIYRRLKRIAKISQQRRGFPMVVKVGRKWMMNFNDFSFVDEKGNRIGG